MSAQIPANHVPNVFHGRARAQKENKVGWCSGSLTIALDESTICPDCGIETSFFNSRPSIDKGRLRLHIHGDCRRGIYLLRLGKYNGAGDYIKIGSARDLVGRCYSHLRDTRHEYCEILHLTPRLGPWKNIEAYEGLVNARLRVEYVGRKNEEYFPYGENIVERAIELMDNPSLLLSDVLDESWTEVYD